MALKFKNSKAVVEAPKSKPKAAKARKAPAAPKAPRAPKVPRASRAKGKATPVARVDKFAHFKDKLDAPVPARVIEQVFEAAKRDPEGFRLSAISIPLELAVIRVLVADTDFGGQMPSDAMVKAVIANKDLGFDAAAFEEKEAAQRLWVKSTLPVYVADKKKARPFSHGFPKPDWDGSYTGQTAHAKTIKEPTGEVNQFFVKMNKAEHDAYILNSINRINADPELSSEEAKKKVVSFRASQERLVQKTGYPVDVLRSMPIFKSVDIFPWIWTGEDWVTDIEWAKRTAEFIPLMPMDTPRRPQAKTHRDESMPGPREEFEITQRYAPKPAERRQTKKAEINAALKRLMG